MTWFTSTATPRTYQCPWRTRSARRAKTRRSMERAMKNERLSREYTRGDFIRAGVVGGVWVLLFVLLAALSVGRTDHSKTATMTGPVAVAGATPAAVVAHRFDPDSSDP